MWYKPAFAVKWNAKSEVADHRYSDSYRSMVVEPVYDLMTKIPMPITRWGLEAYLGEVLAWFRANKYPFGDSDIWLEDIYIVIHRDDELIAEMEVSEQKWQITQCVV